MNVYTSKGICIQLKDRPLNKGGEGAVHLIPAMKNYCAKIYFPEKRTEDRHKKLKFMVSNPPSPLITNLYIICWPVDVIYDINKQFLGFIMPLAFFGSELCYEICRMRLDESLGVKWIYGYNRKSKKGFTNRLRLIVNIASPLRKIHDMKKYVLVDFKPQNLLLTPDGRISIIDLDSVQICDGNNYYPCPVATPEYMPPEIHRNPLLFKKPLDQTYDLFSVAVIFYQILFGLHPYIVTAKDGSITEISQLISHELFAHGRYFHKIAVIPAPHRKFDLLPKEIQKLFKRAFDTNPNDRPSANDWGKVIYSLISILPPTQ